MQLFDDLEDFGEFDDFVSGDVRDPYTELARLRREEPVQRIEIPGIPGEEGKPIFMVYRYEDAQQMLRDNETFSSSIIIQAFGDVFGKHVMLGMDEPEHGRHRALVSKAFSQKALARWEDELVGKVGNALIDRFIDRGSADLVKEFNFPYPTLIIAGLLGLPQEDYSQFQRWSISLLSFTVNPERGREASQALAEYFTPILAARREEPRDDLISGLAAAEIDGEKLSDEEIFSFLRLLLPAGVETTYRSLGNLLFALLTNPDQLDAVRSDRSLLPQAIEEAVRWEPPLIMITRVASRDTELGGVQIPAGCSVMPILGAANRQDERFADPNRFDIFREVKPNIGWGHGVHVCLGMHLARLEMRVALNLLFDRLHNLRLDPAADDPYIRGQAFPVADIASGAVWMTELRFDDRVVVVTGAGRGIGRSHAVLLAAKGAGVVVADFGVGIDGSGSTPTPTEDVVKEIKDTGGQAVACYASVADERGAKAIVDTAIDAFGHIDAVINNAGIHDPALFDALSVEQFHNMLDVHFFGSLFVSRAAWPYFVNSGYGRIVNTVSEAMLGGIPELTSYGSAKGAVFGLTRNLATEGAANGIQVNAIAPRAYTRMSASHTDALSELFPMPKEMRDELNASMPPELCAPAAAFLAHESCPLNGEVLLIGMGSVARIAVVRSQGIWKSPLTAEDIAENLNQVMDLADAQVTESTRSVL